MAAVHPLRPETPPPLDVAAEEAMRRGAELLVSRQKEDGAWSGVYGGPMFLLPMYIAAHHIAGRELPERHREGFLRYYRAIQLADGSFGLHDEAEAGTMFTTVLGYVAQRLLGAPADGEGLSRTRDWIRGHGGPLGSADWGKFVLALLNLYDWEGLNPILPELWLLPRQVPMHPGHMWCHSRQVYLPMAYLYGTRATAPLDERLRALRDELYDRPYEGIDFRRARGQISPTDQLEPATPFMRAVNGVMTAYERRRSTRLRERARRALFEHIRHEDEATHYIRIGPVNAVLNTLVHLFSARERGLRESALVERSFQELERYIEEEPRGALMNGYNSTALWDTAFTVQALLATPVAGEHRDALEQAHEYIRENQVLEDVPERARHFRDPSRGGWPFSDRRHGWPITDCTAEGLKSALLLEGEVPEPVPEGRLREAVELLLGWQNPGGGWSSYEQQRAGTWLETLNPSQVFSRIMVDHPYVECTSAAVQGLVAARTRFPHLASLIDGAIERGAQFIRDEQRPDGSWEGSWGVCFTYGTWFGVIGLRAAGATEGDPAILKARRFLEAHQRADGGWGEHYSSCTQRRYVHHPEGQVVNTAWALLTLCQAGGARSEAAERAARFLVEAQEADGDWPRQAMAGVFNRTTLIHYDNYRRYFPLWALGLWSRR